MQTVELGLVYYPVQAQFKASKSLKFSLRARTCQNESWDMKPDFYMQTEIKLKLTNFFEQKHHTFLLILVFHIPPAGSSNRFSWSSGHWVVAYLSPL